MKKANAGKSREHSSTRLPSSPGRDDSAPPPSKRRRLVRGRRPSTPTPASPYPPAAPPSDATSPKDDDDADWVARDDEDWLPGGVHDDGFIAAPGDIEEPDEDDASLLPGVVIGDVDLVSVGHGSLHVVNGVYLSTAAGEQAATDVIRVILQFLVDSAKSIDWPSFLAAPGSEHAMTLGNLRFLCALSVDFVVALWMPAIKFEVKLLLTQAQWSLDDFKSLPDVISTTRLGCYGIDSERRLPRIAAQGSRAGPSDAYGGSTMRQSPREKLSMIGAPIYSQVTCQRGSLGVCSTKSFVDTTWNISSSGTQSSALFFGMG
jgi:hypothetical protein